MVRWIEETSNYTGGGTEKIGALNSLSLSALDCDKEQLDGLADTDSSKRQQIEIINTIHEQMAVLVKLSNSGRRSQVDSPNFPYSLSNDSIVACTKEQGIKNYVNNQ